uniref:Uncharacterized protein n=1 Tax=Anopheles christyi TaxID=43041 RepID=A0A182KEM2_9DIPT
MGPVDKLTAAGRRTMPVVCRPTPPAHCTLVGVTMCLLLLTASVVQTAFPRYNKCANSKDFPAWLYLSHFLDA